MPGRKVFKGKDLYRILFFGVIFMAAAIGSLAVWGVRDIRRDAVTVAVESSARGLSGAVTVLVNAVSNSNDEIRSEAVANPDSSALRNGFSRMLNKHSSLIAVMISDEQGLIYMLCRRPDGLMETVLDRSGEKSTTWTLLKGDGTSAKAQPNDFFDRQLVDKSLADEFRHLKPGQVNWRSSYRFHDRGESWITASSLVETGKGEKLMASYVFPINAIVDQLGGAEKGGAEKVFIYWETGKVLPVPDMENSRSQTDLVSKTLPSEKVNDPVIAGAAARLASEAGVNSTPFPYTVNGEVWWAYVLPLSVFGDTMSLGVAMPMKNVVSTLTSDNFIQIFSGILVFMAACVLFFLHKNHGIAQGCG